MATLVPQYALQELIGADHVELSADTVEDLLEQAIARWGDEFLARAEKAAIYVNGRNISYQQGKKTRLSDDDVVWLVVPAAGG